MTSKRILAVLAVIGLAAGAAYWTGSIDKARQIMGKPSADGAEMTKAAEAAKAPLAPAVTVASTTPHDFVETVLVTGSLVAREEILVAPEIEGLRVLELKAEEGDRVKKGQVLAVLVADTLEAQLAQSEAEIARAEAGIARARSQVIEMEARAKEAAAALERARPLKRQGWIADSAVDQREAAARSTAAQVVAARDGLKFAEAEKAHAEARRREIDWRRGNVEVKSPAEGLVSRRSARIGALAAAAGEPMFHIVENGEIELDAEVPEFRMASLAIGQPATIEVAGAGTFKGKVRLVSPEVDKATRLGRVRVLVGDEPALRVGAFARGNIETARSRGLAVPQSSVLYGEDRPTVQVVIDGMVHERTIETGLVSGGSVEVKAGLSEGDVVVARAGTFLRDGDAVRPVMPAPKVSETHDKLSASEDTP